MVSFTPDSFRQFHDPPIPPYRMHISQLSQNERVKFRADHNREMQVMVDAVVSKLSILTEEARKAMRNDLLLQGRVAIGVALRTSEGKPESVTKAWKKAVYDSIVEWAKKSRLVSSDKNR